MAQCRGITKKGDQCRREATRDSDFCVIHIDQEVRPPRAARPSEPPPPPLEWDRDALMKTALGFGLVAAILFFRVRR